MSSGNLASSDAVVRNLLVRCPSSSYHVSERTVSAFLAGNPTLLGRLDIKELMVDAHFRFPSTTDTCVHNSAACVLFDFGLLYKQ